MSAMIWMDESTKKFRTRFCPHHHVTEDSAMRCFKTRTRERERELRAAKETIESSGSKDTMMEWVDQQFEVLNENE